MPHPDTSRSSWSLPGWMAWALPLAALLWFGAPCARAAAITWGGATPIASDSDVDTTGTPVLAYFWASPRIDTTVTVNGVTFTNYGSDNSDSAPAQPGPGITISGFTHNWGNMTLTNYQPYPGLTLSLNYCKVLNGMLWGDHQTNCSLTILNLTPSQAYEVQIWCDYSEGSGSNNPVTLSSDGGNSVTLHTNTADVTGGVGQFAIGAFVADAATQTISVNIGDYVGINAIQVRSTTGGGGGTAPAITSALTATATAGAPFSYTLTATGDATITYAASGLPAGLTFSGAKITGTPTAAGAFNVALTATNAAGSDSKTLALTVNPGAAKSFTITGPATVTGGAAANFSATVVDAYGNTVTGYTGTVHFSSSDTNASLPANYTFQASDNSVHGFTVTFNTVGNNQSLTVTDTSTSSITGTLNSITVSPPAPVITSATTYSGTAGVAVSYNITAANSPTSYGASGLPNGLAVNTGTGLISGTTTVAGSYPVTLSATNSIGTGTATLILTIHAGPPCALAVGGMTTPLATGRPGTFTVTAQDSYGNIAASYTGTVAFTSSDAAAVLPAEYTFAANDNGAATFSATFNTVGAQSLTVTDTQNASMTSTQSGIQAKLGRRLSSARTTRQPPQARLSVTPSQLRAACLQLMPPPICRPDLL